MDFFFNNSSNKYCSAAVGIWTGISWRFPAVQDFLSKYLLQFLGYFSCIFYENSSIKSSKIAAYPNNPIGIFTRNVLQKQTSSKIPFEIFFRIFLIFCRFFFWNSSKFKQIFHIFQRVFQKFQWNFLKDSFSKKYHHKFLKLRESCQYFSNVTPVFSLFIIIPQCSA